MASEVARLHKPTAFSGGEEEYSDWEFALTCFVGTVDGTLLTELRVVGANPRVKRVPTDDAGNERARTLYNILALLTTRGPRNIVREVPDQNGCGAYRNLVLGHGSRDAHGETALLIKATLATSMPWRRSSKCLAKNSEDGFQEFNVFCYG